MSATNATGVNQRFGEAAFSSPFFQAYAETLRNLNQNQNVNHRSFCVVDTRRPTVLTGDLYGSGVTPRGSNRHDLDMTAQRKVRLEESLEYRKGQAAATADLHNTIVNDRCYQLQACQLLLVESRLYQLTKEKKNPSLAPRLPGRTSIVVDEVERLTTRLPPPTDLTTDQGEVERFSPTWYSLVRHDMSMLLSEKGRNYCVLVRRQLAEFSLFS
jgi:hypothetical protein